MERILSRQAYAAIKSATKRSVALLGGAESVGALFGMCRQNIERWYRLDENRFIPVSRLFEMETEVASLGAVPAVLQTLADQCGFDLVRRPETSKPDTSPIKANSDLMQAAGKACMTIAQASEDNIITSEERAECKAVLQKVIQQAQNTIVSIDRKSQ